MNPQRFSESRLSALLLSALFCTSVAALPEDAEQPITVDFSSTDYYPDQGLIVHKGNTDKPACITQGTLKICGNEIRLERAEDGSLKKVTATGAPARFQQQPKVDQELVHASGRTLVLDNVAQLMTIDENAELSQAGYVLTHQHIEYDLESGRTTASSTNDARGTMTLPPRAPGN